MAKCASTEYKGDPADVTINSPDDIHMEGMRLLADRILNDIVKSMYHAYKETDIEKRESQLRMYRRMLNDTPWCNILGVTPLYCERRAQNYQRYKKFAKKHKGERLHYRYVKKEYTENVY